MSIVICYNTLKVILGIILHPNKILDHFPICQPMNSLLSADEYICGLTCKNSLSWEGRYGFMNFTSLNCVSHSSPGHTKCLSQMY